MRDVKKELRRMKTVVGVLERRNCSDSDNVMYSGMAKNGSLPEGVYEITYSGQPSGKYYRADYLGLTKEEQQEYLQLKQMDNIDKLAQSVNSIKSMVTFFVVLTVLNLLGSLIMVVNLANMFS